MHRSQREKGPRVCHSDFVPKKKNRVTKEVGTIVFGDLAGEYKVNWGQVIQIIVGRLVANLEKRKPSLISPYLFHLYSRNECLKEEEIEELEIARKYLELGIILDAAGHPDVVEIDSERESLSPRDNRGYWKDLLALRGSSFIAH